MKKKMVFVFLALTLLLSGCNAAEKLKVSSKEEFLAADFKLEDIYHNTLTLSSYKQPVLLFFWTTWCPGCRRGLKVLSEEYQELTKSGVELLTIDVGEPPERVSSYVKNSALAFKVLLDTDTAVARSYDILGVPTYVLINQKGKVVFRENFFPKQYKDLISK